jgi:hypothetical protein
MIPKSERISLFKFRWLRAGSYEVRGMRVFARRGSDVEWFEPDADTPDAHRRFVQLPHRDLDALLAFVRAHGFLGVGEDTTLRASATLSSAYWRIGERLDDLWRAQHRLRRLAQPSTDDPDARHLLFNRASPHMSARLENEHGRTVLRIVPSNLIAWMYLRVGLARTQGHEVRKCALPACTVTREIGHDATERWQYCCPQHRSLHRYRIEAGIDPRKSSKRKKHTKKGVSS